MRKTLLICVVVALSSVLAKGQAGDSAPQEPRVVSEELIEGDEDPRLQMIVDKAIERERLFERVDSTFTTRWFKPGAEEPYSTTSGRWVRDGEKVFQETAEMGYLESGEEHVSRYLFGFDGTLVRSYSKSDNSGNISADVERHLRHADEGRSDQLAVTQTSRPITEMLQPKKTVFEYQGSTIVLEQSVRIVGEETAAGRKCLVIEVRVEVAGVGAELEHLYFAPELGYAPVQKEHWWEKDGKRALGSRIVMGDFKEVAPGVFHPSTAEYEPYQRNPQPVAKALIENEVTFPEMIDPSLFTPQFPQGARVYDLIAETQYVVGDELGGSIEPDALTDLAVEAPAEAAEEPPQPPAAPEAPSEPPLSPQQPVATEGTGHRIPILITLAVAAAVVLLVLRLAKRRR